MTTMTLDLYTAVNLQLEADLNIAKERLAPFRKHRGPAGLLPDSIRLAPEYQSAKQSFDQAFKAIQNFNQNVPNSVKRAASKLRREQKLQQLQNQ